MRRSTCSRRSAAGERSSSRPGRKHAARLRCLARGADSPAQHRRRGDRASRGAPHQALHRGRPAGPLPLANTGLGIFGFGGVFLINGRAKAYNDPDLPPDPEPDVVSYELAWTDKDPRFLKPERGDYGFGLEAVLGTLPDMGFTSSTRAGIFLTLPELQVRGSLAGRIPGLLLARLDDPRGGARPRIEGQGRRRRHDGRRDDRHRGQLRHRARPRDRRPGRRPLPGLPGGRSGRAADWYVYFGADGYPDQGCAIGPIRATVLPGIIGAEADAYLMFRGKGITKFPRGGGKAAEGFVLALSVRVSASQAWALSGLPAGGDWFSLLPDRCVVSNGRPGVKVERPADGRP